MVQARENIVDIVQNANVDNGLDVSIRAEVERFLGVGPLSANDPWMMIPVITVSNMEIGLTPGVPLRDTPTPRHRAVHPAYPFSDQAAGWYANQEQGPREESGANENGKDEERIDRLSTSGRPA
ncbi:hypothetical protein [Sphingomonas abietis]|uniref:Uncharacterized protein n=1 Tax=Sphingomonas abietis TaxID=3012344 RepID=A0ABY7NV32_9SPHN|nr:hypothetical protein [Sphingomonas abietis]WBO24508.1 hypothetical protein PBT88_10590 [Sphingomonas abietis]